MDLPALAVHTPEVCLQLRGYRLIEDQDEILINIPGANQPVPFEAQTFSYHSEIVHIFRCYWPDRLLDGKFPGFPKQGYSTSGRLRAAFKGFRNPGATMIAIGLFENSIIRNFDLAKEAVERELATKVKASIFFFRPVMFWITASKHFSYLWIGIFPEPGNIGGDLDGFPVRSQNLNGQDVTSSCQGRM